MNKSRLQIAKPDIVKFFKDGQNKIFNLKDLAAILTEQREFWRLAQRTTTEHFLTFLQKNASLRKISLPFPYRSEHRYVWGDVPLLEVLLTVKKLSYYTHYTAVRMHGLTEQLPKTIYLNHEQPPHAQNRALQQAKIDAAFSRAPRVSNNVIEIDDLRICLINGMQTNQLGVIEVTANYYGSGDAKVRVTGIERTLIDIAVRPIYAGGVAEVAKAYALARGKVSVNRMAAMLQKLGYVYPYHQAIGFYLDRAGYDDSAIDPIRHFPMEFDFYLAHKMGETAYDERWRLHIPKGF